jgi:hypothetical protein
MHLAYRTGRHKGHDVDMHCALRVHFPCALCDPLLFLFITGSPGCFSVEQYRGYLSRHHLLS